LRTIIERQIVGCDIDGYYSRAAPIALAFRSPRGEDSLWRPRRPQSATTARNSGNIRKYLVDPLPKKFAMV
jgi:hypothetical protein